MIHKCIYKTHSRYSIIRGSSSKDDGDGNKNVKKAIGLLRKTTNLHCITLFCTFLCRHCTTTTWKCLTARFMEDVNKRRRIFLCLSKPEHGPQETNPEKSIYIWHFKSDVSAAVAVVVAKAPYCYLYNGKEARQVAPCKGTQDSIGIWNTRCGYCIPQTIFCRILRSGWPNMTLEFIRQFKFTAIYYVICIWWEGLTHLSKTLAFGHKFAGNVK